jgi:hypothetical protein
VFGVAALITLAGIAGALWLGAWAFETRSALFHQRRLANLLSHAPTLEQVDEALRKEGTLPLGTADDAATLRALAERHAGEQAAAVLAAARSHRHTRAYAAGEKVYFIHFDARGVMRAFTLVSRRRGA